MRASSTLTASSHCLALDVSKPLLPHDTDPPHRGSGLGFSREEEEEDDAVLVQHADLVQTSPNRHSGHRPGTAPPSRRAGNDEIGECAHGHAELIHQRSRIWHGRFGPISEETPLKMLAHAHALQAPTHSLT